VKEHKTRCRFEKTPEVPTLNKGIAEGGGAHAKVIEKKSIDTRTNRL